MMNFCEDEKTEEKKNSNLRASTRRGRSRKREKKNPAAPRNLRSGWNEACVKQGKKTRPKCDQPDVGAQTKKMEKRREDTYPKINRKEHRGASSHVSLEKKKKKNKGGVGK